VCAGREYRNKKNRGDKERRNVIPQQRLSVASLILLPSHRDEKGETWRDQTHINQTSTHKKKKEIIIMRMPLSLIKKKKKGQSMTTFRLHVAIGFDCGTFPIFFEKNKFTVIGACVRCSRIRCA
jgi:hypothetical protein